MKHFFKVTALGIVLGILLVVIQHWMEIPTDRFLRNYYWMAGVVIAAAALVNLLYNLWYQNKIRKAAKLLEDRPEAFLEEIEALRRRAKGKALQSVLRLDLTAGYCALERYDEAIEILEDLSRMKFRGGAEMVRRLNLCLCYFGAKQGDKALSLYEDSEKIFAPFRKSAAYGGNLAVLEVYAAMEREQCEEAASLLAQARESWRLPALEKTYQEMETLLAERREKP